MQGPCGEGAGSRRAAQQSSYLRHRIAGFATAAQSSGSELPRHKGWATL